MKNLSEEEQQIFKLLTRRYERLLEKYALNAPALIKKFDVDLIIEAATRLKEIYNKME